jgi:hypothetical protein
MQKERDEKLAATLAEVGDVLDDDVTLHLVEFRDGVARVEVRLAPEACEDCVVPAPILKGIVQDRLAKAGVAVESVELIETRPTS